MIYNFRMCSGKNVEVEFDSDSDAIETAEKSLNHPMIDRATLIILDEKGALIAVTEKNDEDIITFF